MRFIGHLDLFKTWERTLRRAKIPIAYSQGFHPNPRINLASALPLGITSDCELLDVWLETPMDLSVIHENLQKALPPGIQIHSIEEVHSQAPALQTQVVGAEYVVTLLKPVEDLHLHINHLLSSNTLPRYRRDKSYDLRALIEELALQPCKSDAPPQLFMRLTAREGATGRPDDVLDAIGIPITEVRIKRTRLILKNPSP